MTVSITLIGKPGCHLCDDAREVIHSVRDELAALPERKRVAVEIRELDILTDEQLARQHSEHIPVVLIGEKRHAILQVDRERFLHAVVKAAKPSVFSLRRS